MGQTEAPQHYTGSAVMRTNATRLRGNGRASLVMSVPTVPRRHSCQALRWQQSIHGTELGAEDAGEEALRAHSAGAHSGWGNGLQYPKGLLPAFRNPANIRSPPNKWVLMHNLSNILLRNNMIYIPLAFVVWSR